MSYSAEEVVQLIKVAEQQGATEIHFKVPNRPLLRIDGRLVPHDAPSLTPQTTIQVAQTCLRFANKEIPVANVIHEEIGFGLANRGRFHAILYRQRGSVAVILRIISQDVVPLVNLGLDDAEELLGHRGLVLIAGPRRLDALASLIDRYNASHRGAVVTVEQPLTVLHRDAMAAISQREVGVDVASIAEGVESAIRQRPDLIAVTDVPNAAASEAVLKAAEEGIQIIACVAASELDLTQEWVFRNFDPRSQSAQAERIARVMNQSIWASSQST